MKQRLHIGVGRKLTHQRHTAAHKQGRQQLRPQRHWTGDGCGDQGDVVLHQRHPGQILLDARDHGGPGKGHALGPGRSSGRIDHDAQIIVLERLGKRRRRGSRHQLLKTSVTRVNGVATDHHDLRHPSQHPGLPQFLQALLMNDQNRRAAMAKGVSDLDGSVPIVQRHHDEVGLEAGEVGQNRGWAIREEDGHAIPGFDSQFHEIGGEPGGGLLQFGSGPESVLELQHPSPGFIIQSALQELVEHVRFLGWAASGVPTHHRQNVSDAAAKVERRKLMGAWFSLLTASTVRRRMSTFDSWQIGICHGEAAQQDPRTVAGRAGSIPIRTPPAAHVGQFYSYV